ncbi:hypothetical protein EDC96DRAFT_543716 [Choanephora cucurbitarum]|nr:hypothetical protein EDC96DRAFT_543716 [Choanephora cucurbitarum]
MRNVFGRRLIDMKTSFSTSNNAKLLKLEKMLKSESVVQVGKSLLSFFDAFAYNKCNCSNYDNRKEYKKITYPSKAYFGVKLMLAVLKCFFLLYSNPSSGKMNKCNDVVFTSFEEMSITRR